MARNAVRGVFLTQEAEVGAGVRNGSERIVRGILLSFCMAILSLPTPGTIFCGRGEYPESERSSTLPGAARCCRNATDILQTTCQDDVALLDGGAAQILPPMRGRRLTLSRSHQLPASHSRYTETEQYEVSRSWPAYSEATVRGHHTPLEDCSTEIGQVLAMDGTPLACASRVACFAICCQARCAVGRWVGECCRKDVSERLACTMLARPVRIRRKAGLHGHCSLALSQRLSIQWCLCARLLNGSRRMIGRAPALSGERRDAGSQLC